MKKGEPQSKKYQLLIDQLLNGSLFNILGKSATVTANSSDTKTGYGAFAHLRPVKERVTVKNQIMWVTCPKDNQPHRISLCLNCNDPDFAYCKDQIKKYMEA